MNREVLALYLIVAAALIVLGWWARLFISRGIGKPSVRGLDFRPTWSVPGGREYVAHATHGSIRYEYRVGPGTKQTAPSARIRIEAPGRGEFAVSTEGRLDRLAKRVGLAAEVQTGDPSFDEAYFIESDTPAFARAVFQQPEARAAVRATLGWGFSAVRHDGRGLEAVYPATPADYLPAGALVEETVGRLAAVAGRFPTTAPAAPDRVPAWPRRGLLALPMSLGGLGVVALFLGLNLMPRDGLFAFGRASLWISLPAALAFLGLVACAGRGRASAHRDLAAVALATVVGFPLAGTGLGILANAWLDRSPVASHTVTVYGKELKRVKQEHYYFVDVASWRGSGSERLGVSARVFEGLVVGQSRLVVSTRRGAFGWERLVDVRPLP